MTEQRYTIIFEGKIQEGRSPEEVRQNLADLFKLNEEKAARLFEGETVIKKDADRETAARYQKAFRQAGALCAVIPSPVPDRDDRILWGDTGEPESPPPLPPAPGRTEIDARWTEVLEGAPEQEAPRSGKRRFSLFHPLYLCFFSKDLYRDAAANWRAASFVYLLLLVGLLSAVIALKLHTQLSEFQARSAAAFIRQIPDIHIEQGKMRADADQPYHIIDPETNRPIVTIDATGRITSLQQTDAKALLTETRLIFEKNRHRTETIDLSQVRYFEINQERAYNWLNVFVRWCAVIMFPILVFGLYVYKLLQVLIYAALGVIFTKLLNADLRYGALVSLAVMAITPVALIDVLIFLTEIKIPFWFFGSFLAAMGFLFFGVKAARD